MSWPTDPPSPAPASNGFGSEEHSGYTTLFTRIGTRGWSALVSYSESWSASGLGAWPAPGSSLAVLRDLDLIGFEQLPAGSAGTISVLYLTPAGRRHLLEMRLPPVHTEYERLRDRWGTRAEEHHGQVILFATLARRFGYHAEVGVAAPGQRQFADVKLTREDGTESWCLVESGSHRDTHPLDRWRRLGRCQPFLPLVAPDRTTMNRLGEQARPHIYRVRLTNLDELLLNADSGNNRLWLTGIDRFRDADRGRNRVVPGLRSRLVFQFQGHVQARAAHRRQHGCTQQRPTPRAAGPA